MTHALSLPQSTTDMVTYLSTRRPESVDKQVVSLALSHGVTLEPRKQGRYPKGPNGEKLSAYDVVVDCTAYGTEERKRRALEDVARLETPADIRSIEIWLAELSVLTAGRGVDGANAELLVTAYSSRLTQYPADIVKHALLGKAWKWFPSWYELEKICEEKALGRRRMVQSLRHSSEEQEQERPRATAEEAADVLRQAGVKVDENGKVVGL